MIIVSLTQGQIAIIDDIDADLMKRHWRAYKNNKRVFYAVSKNYPMHRIILARVLGRALTKSETVDHINCNGLDNRRSNLRLATRSQQKANTPKEISYNGKPTYSKYKGVTWYKNKSKWGARIQCNRVERHLGLFVDEEDAAKAYDKAAKECFGEFANLNFPNHLVTASGI